MILNGNSESHGAKRKLELAAPSSKSVTLNELCAAEKLNTRDEEVEADYEPVPVLNPEDVSKTFSESTETCVKLKHQTAAQLMQVQLVCRILSFDF